MKVLMSGATGLIGTALTHALESRGDEVISLTRPRSTAQLPTSVAWDPEHGSLNVEQLDALGPFGAIVHLAGAGIADKRWSTTRKAEILESRVASTALLAETATRLSTAPRSFISGSAIGYYGSQGDTELDESSPQGTGFLADVCAAWEAAAQRVQDANIRTVLVRTGIVLSTKGGALAKQLPLFKAGLGGKLSSGSQWLSWISIDDEVAALLALIDHDSFEGPVNLTAPHPVTNATFTKTLGKVLGRPTLLSVPAPALKGALGGELVEEALLASQRVLPRKLLQSDFRFGTEDLETALRNLLA